MPIPLLAIGAGLGIANSIGRLFSGGRQRREANKINPIFKQYQASPFAKQQLGIAQQLFNARTPGAAGMERNIQNSQASAIANINRNATSSADALALAGASQGLTNQSYDNLANKEAQNKQAMLANLNEAYGTNIREGDKEYDSMLQKYQMDSQRQDALRNAGAQNQYGAIGDLSSMAFMFGGMQNPFGFGGGNKRNNTQQFLTPQYDRIER